VQINLHLDAWQIHVKTLFAQGIIFLFSDGKQNIRSSTSILPGSDAISYQIKQPHPMGKVQIHISALEKAKVLHSVGQNEHPLRGHSFKR